MSRPRILYAVAIACAAVAAPVVAQETVPTLRPGQRRASATPGNTFPAEGRRSVLNIQPYRVGGSTGSYESPRGPMPYPVRQYQNANPPNIVAQFGSGPGVTDRAGQLAAQQVGINRNQALNQHLEAYARPFYGGFGFGFGIGSPF